MGKLLVTVGLVLLVAGLAWPFLSRLGLGRLPGDNPIPDGLKVGADGRLYVTDILAKGIHVLQPDGKAERFIPCGIAPTNCAFDGETLWLTDAGTLAASAEPSREGRIWRLHSSRSRASHTPTSRAGRSNEWRASRRGARGASIRIRPRRTS